MRRMPPWTMENSLAGLIELVPQLEDDLLNHIDQPLKVETDTTAGRDFILCDYNRDGDSYRSPWTNEYFPAPDEESGFLPSNKLRKLEVEANGIFDVVRSGECFLP
jgi:capping protein beta